MREPGESILAPDFQKVRGKDMLKKTRRVASILPLPTLSNVQHWKGEGLNQALRLENQHQAPAMKSSARSSTAPGQCTLQVKPVEPC